MFSTTVGYLFLVNVIIILMQSRAVIEIFYDVLALQFVQSLDDIAFRMSKMDVLGKHMLRATMTSYFHTQLQKQKESNLRRVKGFLKAIYFINLAGFLSAMTVVSVRQSRGYYQCGSITLTLDPNLVWREAVFKWPDDSVNYPAGLYEEMILVYSYFNGVYAKDDSRTYEGRPVYIEQNKFDRTPFDAKAPLYDPYSGTESNIDAIKPAEIRYCGGHWILTHDYIVKSKKGKAEECPWLLRSPETEEFDLLEIDGSWQVWTSGIEDTSVSIKCNECVSDSDCNLNGVCDNGKCDCDVDERAVFLGTHCEVKLKNECRTIIGKEHNDTWSVGVMTKFGPEGSSTEVIDQEYSRPVYAYVGGLPDELSPDEGNGYSLIYSGSRWFRINLKGANVQGGDIEERIAEFWLWMTTNYHGESSTN